jgi:cell division protein FtsA
MGMNEVIAGLDIGTSKVSIVIGEINEGDDLQVIGIGTSPCSGVKKGMVVDIDNTIVAIVSALEQAETMSNVKITGVYVNMSGGDVQFIRNKGLISISGQDREISHEHIYKVMEAAKTVDVMPGGQIIDVLPVQYIVDGYDRILDPVGMVGSRLELEADVIICPITTINTIERCVKNAGLETRGLVIESLATGSSVLTKDEKELGCVLVNVGAGKTELGIFKKGVLKYTGYIPVGGNNISNDLSIGLNIDFKLADEIKKTYGLVEVDPASGRSTGVSSSNHNQSYDLDICRAREIMQARVQEMFALIKYEIEDSGYHDTAGSRIVLTGGGLAMLSGAAQVGEEILGQGFRIGRPAYIGATSPIYSLAVGLVKYMYEKQGLGSPSVGRRARYNSNKKKKMPVFANKIKQIFSDFF